MKIEWRTIMQSHEIRLKLQLVGLVLLVHFWLDLEAYKILISHEWTFVVVDWLMKKMSI